MERLESIVENSFFKNIKNKLFTSLIAATLTFTPLPSHAIENYTIGFSYGTGGFKAGINYSHSFDNLSLGSGITYHSNYYNTDKSGFQIRISAISKLYSEDNNKISLGTNKWIGFKELKEFNQQTAILKLKYDKLEFDYEQDGNFFTDIALSDGCDRYKTAAATLKYQNKSLDLKLFTGNRDEISYKKEKELKNKKNTVISHRDGEFGEVYKNGLVYERGKKYRYSALTYNHKNISIGINSEWIRHYFQNKLAHTTS